MSTDKKTKLYFRASSAKETDEQYSKMMEEALNRQQQREREQEQEKT